WADPVDAILLLQGFRQAVDAVASRTGCTELADYQLKGALGLSHGYELAQLKSKGLLVHRRDGHYVCDTRDFARWVAQQCDRLRAMPRRERSAQPVGSQGTLL
ncbi:hypothetical protein, partial [Bifidobacterium phasiani]